MKFIKIEDKKDVYYIDPYRFPEWYYAAKQYHYIEPDKQYEETHNSDNITAETYSGLREMILKKQVTLRG